MIDDIAEVNPVNRRGALRWLGLGAAAFAVSGGAEAAQLPLNTTGLEHYGMTVPDPEAAAKFYGRIFDPQLFQERDPPPRFYARLGSAYLAFGLNKEVPPFIDHFCALTQGYAQGELRKLLEDAGVTMGAGALGMATDPDGLRLQTLGVPGGLARTIVPASRITTDDALFQAVGTDHVLLRVSNLEKSAAHYRKIFGMETSHVRNRVWFTVAKTKLGLEAAPAGEKPSIYHICVRVAGLDRKKAADKLKSIGVEVLPQDDLGLVRFRDLNGLIMGMRGDA